MDERRAESVRGRGGPQGATIRRKKIMKKRFGRGIEFGKINFDAHLFGILSPPPFPLRSN